MTDFPSQLERWQHAEPGPLLWILAERMLYHHHQAACLRLWRGWSKQPSEALPTIPGPEAYDTLRDKHNLVGKGKRAWSWRPWLHLGGPRRFA
jgi:hypothetical protein